MAAIVQLSLTMALVLPLASLAQDQCNVDNKIFQRGDNLGSSYLIRCGTPEEFPCFCNPDLSNQAFCPYCGFSAGDGTLYCAKDQETITFQDGSIVRVCSCDIPDDPFAAAIKSCDIETEPSPPTDAPVNSPGGLDAGICIFPNFDGDLVTFQDGESFGDLIEGICGTFDEWPSLCSAPPGGDGNDFIIAYPYCVFDDAVDGTLCAKDGEEFTFTDTNSVTFRCTCTYSGAELADSECTEVNGSSTPNPGTGGGPTPAPAATPAPVVTGGGGTDTSEPTEPAEPNSTPDPTKAPETQPKGSSAAEITFSMHVIISMAITTTIYSCGLCWPFL